MSNVIKLKRGSGSDPSASDLVVGEIAIRSDSGKLFTKKDNGTVAEISGGGISDGDKGDITVSNGGDTFTIDDEAVTNAKLGDLSINNAKVASNAAIAGSKISPDFGSQDITTTGNFGAANVNITDNSPSLIFTDSAANSDFRIRVQSGVLKLRDDTNSADRLTIASDGTTTIAQNLDVGAGLDVTGAITATSHLDMPDSAIIKLGTGDDLQIFHDGTNTMIDNDTGDLKISSSGTLRLRGNSVGIQNENQTETMAFFTQNGAAKLYYDNVEKLETTSAGIDVDGSITCDDIVTAGALLHEGDTNTLVHFDANDQISLKTNGTTRLQVVNAGINVTGNVVATGNIEINSAYPIIKLTDTNNNDDFEIRNADGIFIVRDATNSVDRLSINSSGSASLTGSLFVSSNITTSGTVDGVDIAARDTLFGGLTSSSGVLTNGVTGTTQGASDNTTKVATTAYVTTAVNNLINGAPAALDTLNELAAAMNDDAAFSTTVTNSLATKMPLAGGQFTGNITFSGSQTVDGRDLSVDGSKLDGIESGATADQTASEILTLIKTVDGTGSGLNADLLDGIDSSQFLRSDAVDSCSGSISFTGEIKFGQSYSDPEFGVQRDAKFGDNGIAVVGGIKTDTLNSTGNISCGGTVDGRDLATDGTKLDGIEASATADQTASEILTLIKTVDGAGSGLDADTLDGATSSFFQNASNLSSGTVPQARLSASTLLTLIKTVDGAGSGLDADTLDGISSASFLRSDTNTTATGDITVSGGGGALTVAANSDVRFNTGNWTGDAYGKIQHHANRLYLGVGSNPDPSFVIRYSGTDRIYMNSSGTFYPVQDSNADLGKTGTRWRNGYFDTLYGDGSNLTGISAGATGGGSDEVFYENSQTVTTNYTITNGKNAMSAGPITINSGVTVTVGSGETLTIV